jgi:hypothetical protein
MDASLPAGQTNAAISPAAGTIDTTLSAQQLYQNDLLLVLLKDKLRLHNFLIVAGVAGLAAFALFVLYAFAGMPQTSPGQSSQIGYFVRAIVQTILVLPVLTWVYLTLPDNIANHFNTLQTNKVIGNLQPNTSGVNSYSDFLSKLIAAADNFWWVAGTMIFVSLYWLYRLLVLNPLTQSSYPLWLQLANLVIYAPMVYSVLLTTIRLLVTLVYTNKLFQLFAVQLNPLHPDGSAGLGFLENMLKTSVYLTLFTGLGAIVLNPAFLGVNVNVFSVVEAVILSILYTGMSLTFFIGWLLVPHNAMQDAHDIVLQSLATEFQAAIIQTAPGPDDDTNTIKAGTDRLTEINRRYQLLDSTYPTWPLEFVQVRRLVGAVSVPALITLLWPFISKLIPALVIGINNLLTFLQK